MPISSTNMAYLNRDSCNTRYTFAKILHLGFSAVLIIEIFPPFVSRLFAYNV